MKKVFERSIIVYLALSIIIQIVAIVIYPVNHYVTGLILILKAVVLYFYIVAKVANWNWLDIRAVFSGVWFLTIGLASLRLTDYQKEWEVITWICLELAYVCIQVGATYGNLFSEWLLCKAIELNNKNKKFYFKFAPRRLFVACIVITLIGITCFIINIMIRGYVPFFTTDDAAYVNFYTKFHVFSVAATMVSGPCYYCIKTMSLKKSQKVVLWICILYATILFPTLVVSRGAFLTSALSLATAIFYLNKKKLWVLIASVVAIFGIYLLLSQARGYTNDQLLVFFEPSKIVLNNEKDTQKQDETEYETESEMETEVDSTETVDNNTVNEGEENTFVLPGSVVFVYSYLTVSHDNFNEAFINNVQFSFGGKQLQPFNVILRSSIIEDMTKGQIIYTVRPHLNTVNLIGHFYYDFGIPGIAILCFAWGMIFMTIQSLYEKTKGAFSLWALGNTMSPIVLCFFTPWLTIFSHWMHWGLAFITWIVVEIHIKRSDR